jgi:hypothetical protein
LEFFAAAIFQTCGNDLTGKPFGYQLVLDTVAPVPLALEPIGIHVCKARIIQIMKAQALADRPFDLIRGKPPINQLPG